MAFSSRECCSIAKNERTREVGGSEAPRAVAPKGFNSRPDPIPGRTLPDIPIAGGNCATATTSERLMKARPRSRRGRPIMNAPPR
jgi:hypothetical protein